MQTARAGRCSVPHGEFSLHATLPTFCWQEPLVLGPSKLTRGYDSRPHPFHFFRTRGQRLHPVEMPRSHAARDRWSSPSPAWGRNPSFVPAMGGEQQLPFPGWRNPAAAPGLIWSEASFSLTLVTAPPRLTGSQPHFLVRPKALRETRSLCNLLTSSGGKARAAAARLPPPGCKLHTAQIPKETALLLLYFQVMSIDYRQGLQTWWRRGWELLRLLLSPELR